MMRKKTIHLARDYNAYPAGRFPEDGDYNGQRFREEYLIPALMQYDQVVVDIEGVRSFGSSFLDEAFGGLLRSRRIEIPSMVKKLTIEAHSPPYKIYQSLIKTYLIGL